MNKKIVNKLKLAGLGVIAFLVLWFFAGYGTYSSSNMNLGKEAVIYQVKAGSSVKTIARDLAEKNLLSSPMFFQLFARLNGKASKIQRGVYEIKPGMTPEQFLDAIANGKVVSFAFTIIEGWNIRQLMDELSKEDKIIHTVRTGQDVTKKLGIAGRHPEGLLMPDTYFFSPGSTDMDFIRKAYAAMDTYLKAKWPGRDKNLPFESPYQALIMASIVEKETGVVDERPAIAGVFIRRLQKGMRLQTDPTVIYGLGEKYDGNLRRQDLLSDTVYNTYTRQGLPPTPIAMPSRAAIDAALHPAKGSALYFVASGKGDGRHVFSDTLEQHNKAVRDYLIERRKHLHAKDKA